MFCMACGQQLPDSARFCSHCGQKLEDVAEQADPPQWSEAIHGYRDIEEIMAEDAWVAQCWGLLPIADQNELRTVWAFIQRNGPGSESIKKQLRYYRQLVSQPKRTEIQQEITHLKEEQDVAARVLSKEWLVRAGAKHTEKPNEFQRWLRLEVCVQSLYLEVMNADNGVVQAEAVVLNDEQGMLAWPASSVERWAPRLPGL